MITNLKLQNFKQFRSQDFSLKPLTLLSGLNNTGKSSIIQALLLLRHSYLRGLLTCGKLYGSIAGLIPKDLNHGDLVGFCLTIQNGISGQWTFNYVGSGDGKCDGLSQNSWTNQMSPIYQTSLFGENFYHHQGQYTVLDTLKHVKPGSLFVLECPENYLHASYQYEVGQIIASIVADGSSQVIVKTHSEHILNGIRFTVKSGKLKPHNITLLHFLQPTKIVSPQIFPSGGIDQWPDGFFDQSTSNLIDLL